MVTECMTSFEDDKVTKLNKCQKVIFNRPVDKLNDILVEMGYEVVEVFSMSLCIKTLAADPFHSVPEIRQKYKLIVAVLQKCAGLFQRYSAVLDLLLYISSLNLVW